jgi:hypothetical protein
MGYATYDLLAKRVFQYGYVYPFLELLLGILYILSAREAVVNGLTLVLMVFSGHGVLQAMRQKRAIQCACLGTFLKVPLTSVTLIEDFGMALMAGVMLLQIFR